MLKFVKIIRQNRNVNIIFPCSGINIMFPEPVVFQPDVRAAQDRDPGWANRPERFTLSLIHIWELNHADSQSVNTLLHTISDFERISDHSVNLLKSADEMHTKNVQFSQDAREELQVLEDAVQDTLNRTTEAFRKGDLHLASKVEPLEQVVDELVDVYKRQP